MINNKETTEQSNRSFSNWYDKYYKMLLFIPVILLIVSFFYLMYNYSNTGDFIKKDISLTGGTSITILGESNENFESELKSSFSDSSIRKLTELRSGKQTSFIIETSAEPDEIKPFIEKTLGYELNETNSNIEFTGSSLSKNFYKQLITALILSFILMSLVVLFLFRTFIPSIAVIFAAFADIVMSLAFINIIEMEISAAGIAAFLMLIGYSVDTDILLTSRALKRREISLNKRIFGAFKTGILMTLTALIAVLPVFFIIHGIPDSFRQIFFILAVGLVADIFNTWLTNTSIIKWYCEVKKI